MIQDRNSIRVYLAIGAMTLLVVVFALSAWRGGETTGGAAHAVAAAVPDIRPRLPEAPHVPKLPLPVPK